MQEQALVPRLIVGRGNQTLENVISIVGGVGIISLLAQISIPLPWTPVPITGQTLGVAMVALNWGRKRAGAILLSYVGLGAVGLPVFAAGASGFSFGPTTGYLVGMIFASLLMGTLADLGWTKTFLGAWLAAFLGSLVIFGCGVLGLSFFVPAADLIRDGVLPFVPGDLLKTLIASLAAYRAGRFVQEVS